MEKIEPGSQAKLYYQGKSSYRMPANDLFNLIMGFFPWGFIKLSALLLIGFYAEFAAVIVRQETLMSHVVGIPPLSPALKVVALAHFFVSILVFFLALILL